MAKDFITFRNMKLNDNYNIDFEISVTEALVLTKTVQNEFKDLRYHLKDENQKMFKNIFKILLVYFNIKKKGASTLFGLITTDKESTANKIVEAEKRIDSMKRDIYEIYKLLTRLESSLEYTITKPFNFNDDVEEWWTEIKKELVELNVTVPENLESIYKIYKEKIVDDYHRSKYGY